MNITLNVQGQIFQIDYDTIIKIPYFNELFDACGIPTEAIFIDRQPHIFKHILALMDNNLYPYPKKYRDELDYFAIDY
jgi:hypothetical protein